MLKEYEETTIELENKTAALNTMREWVITQELKGNVLPEVSYLLLVQLEKETEELETAAGDLLGILENDYETYL